MSWTCETRPPFARTQASPVHSGRTEVIALWIVQFALAGMFLLAGGSKLFGAAPMVAMFGAIALTLVGSAAVVWARRHQLGSALSMVR